MRFGDGGSGGSKKGSGVELERVTEQPAGSCWVCGAAGWTR